MKVKSKTPAKKSSWHTIDFYPADEYEYDIENALYDTAENYRKEAECLRKSGMITPQILSTVQIATECYLKNIIEIEYQSSVYNIYNKGRNRIVPHNLEMLYGDIYPLNGSAKNTFLPYGFSKQIAHALNQLFLDFQASRFPVSQDDPDHYKYRLVTAEDIQTDFQTMDETKNFVDQCRTRYFALQTEADKSKDTYDVTDKEQKI